MPKVRALARNLCLSVSLLQVTGGLEDAEPWPRDQRCWLKEQAGMGREISGSLTSSRVSLSSTWDMEGTLEIMETIDG